MGTKRELPENLKKLFGFHFGCGADCLGNITGFPFIGELYDYLPEADIKAGRALSLLEGPFNISGMATIKGADSMRTMLRLAFKVAALNNLDPLEYFPNLGTVIYTVKLKNLLDVRDKRVLKLLNVEPWVFLGADSFLPEKRERSQLIGMAAWFHGFEGVIYASPLGNHVVVFLGGAVVHPSMKPGPSLKWVIESEEGEKLILQARNQKTLAESLKEEIERLEEKK
jgi:hypothetical protein